MVSFMHSSVDRASATGRLRSRLMLAAALWALCSQSAAAGIVVENARTQLVDDFYVIDADIRYDFGRPALEAITNGVPLTIVVEIEIRQPRDYLWDPKVAKIRHSYRLEHHPLTGQYLVVDLGKGARRSYPSLAQAAAALGRLEQVPVIGQQRLSPHGTYRAYLRAELDFEALPTPLRLLAYFSPSWYLSSGWYRWEFHS